jgi:hypothetical protein
LGAQETGITMGVGTGTSVLMLVSWVKRSCTNLIAQDTSPIFQAQNCLLPVDRAVGIGEKCQLIFDSKLTTYANLNKLNRMGIQFITLRRRSKKLLDATAQTPASAWRRIELESTSRAYKTPRVLDQRITLNDYDGPLRQLTIAELGHEEPTLLLTNQLSRSAARLIGRYAQRMLIENNIEDGVDFFHMDALSSAVAMKVNCDLQLTLMASSLYRLLAVRIGNRYEVAKSRHLFRDFVDASAEISITESEIVVRYPKRAHNPLLLAAGFDKTDEVVPWLCRKRLRLVFG